MQVMYQSIRPLVAPPVHKQTCIFNSSLLNLLIYAPNRIIQIDISGPSAEFGWDIFRVDVKHRSILLLCLELNCS